ncbi:MAG: hypothetical protein R3B84_09280 [Zavarzinella sp.]
MFKLFVALQIGLSALTIQAADFSPQAWELIQGSSASKKLIQEQTSDRFRKLKEAANQRSTAEWNALKDLPTWEKFRDGKIAALKAKLGYFPENPVPLRMEITKTIDRGSHVVENLLFQTRENFWVSANLYRPKKLQKNSPGIQICHSHHNPKTQSELQDMGVLWARAGCCVLIPDQLGHGERRTHPFTRPEDYPQEFRSSRQDYYFRYDTGYRLSLLGDTLIGWMAWDMMRGTDLLLTKYECDPKRIALLGSVAGGGDPVAVTAALDPRITCVVPFNFGGPQPETPYPLPKNAVQTFNFMGGGSWESTRNIAFSAKDGFLPWVIVGSVAPRYLGYAHEFAWSAENDPVWHRFGKIWQWYEQPDNISAVHGSGSVRGSAPESTHCNNIGAVHRKMLLPKLNAWFQINAVEVQDRLESKDLLCWTEEARQKLKPASFLEILKQEKIARSESFLRNDQLAHFVSNLVFRSPTPFEVGSVKTSETPISGGKLIRLEVDFRDVTTTPVVIFQPKGAANGVVYCLCGTGKEAFVTKNAPLIEECIRKQLILVVPDLLHAGESTTGTSLGRSSTLTGRGATELMFGETIFGMRMNQAAALHQWLRTKEELVGSKLPWAIFGESTQPANESAKAAVAPYAIAKEPTIGSPDGAAMAMLLADKLTNVRAVLARGGVLGFDAPLNTNSIQLPFSMAVPGAGQWDVLNYRLNNWPEKISLRMERPLDGHNVVLTDSEIKKLQQQIAGKKVSRTEIRAQESNEKAVADWLDRQFSAKP